MKRATDICVIGAAVFLALIAGIACGSEPSAGSTGAGVGPSPESDESVSESGRESRRGAPVRVLELVRDSGSGPVSVRISVEPSPELPDRPAEASGIFVRSEDNSIIVGTGGIELNVNVEQVAGAAPTHELSLSHDGPEIEVVVTHETVLYQEETEMPSPSKSGDYTIQQVIKLVDSLDEIGKNTELQVWDRRSGDRVVAEVLVYRSVDDDLPF